MTVDLTYRGDVAHVTLNRPSALNALNRAMLQRLREIIDDVATSTARALIVSGAGERAFCAGADVGELEGLNGEQQRAGARFGQLTFCRLTELAIPSVAVIHGAAFGGGLELAMACTFRIAAPAARLGLPEIKLGLLPGYGGTQRLPRLVGVRRALDLVASGRAVPAEEALEMGLVDELIEIADPFEAGLDYLNRFRSAPASMALARQAVLRSAALSLEDGLRMEADLFSQATQTADAGEGMRAFLEKRSAQFRGA